LFAIPVNALCKKSFKFPTTKTKQHTTDKKNHCQQKNKLNSATKKEKEPKKERRDNYTITYFILVNSIL